MKLHKNVINSVQDERERRKLEHVPELILAVGIGRSRMARKKLRQPRLLLPSRPPPCPRISSSFRFDRIIMSVVRA